MSPHRTSRTLRSPCLGRALVGLSLLALALALGAAPLTQAQAKLVVKIGTSARADAPLGALMEAMAQELDARGAQRFWVKRFADGALGAARPALERVEAGEVQAYVATFTELTRFVPALAAVSAPLLFGSADELHKRRGQAVTKLFAEVLAARGIALAGIGPCEARVLASAAPLAPDQMSKLRMRDPGTTATRALYAALSASMLPASDPGDPELADSTLDALIATRATSWARHVTLIDHAVECSAVVYSQRWLNGLPEAVQKDLRPAPDAILDRAVGSHAALRVQLLTALEGMGVTIERRAPRVRRALTEPARIATQELVRSLGADAARIVAAARR